MTSQEEKRILNQLRDFQTINKYLKNMSKKTILILGEGDESGSQQSLFSLANWLVGRTISSDETEQVGLFYKYQFYQEDTLLEIPTNTVPFKMLLIHHNDCNVICLPNINKQSQTLQYLQLQMLRTYALKAILKNTQQIAIYATAKIQKLYKTKLDICTQRIQNFNKFIEYGQNTKINLMIYGIESIKNKQLFLNELNGKVGNIIFVPIGTQKQKYNVQPNNQDILTYFSEGFIYVQNDIKPRFIPNLAKPLQSSKQNRQQRQKEIQAIRMSNAQINQTITKNFVQIQKMLQNLFTPFLSIVEQFVDELKPREYQNEDMYTNKMSKSQLSSASQIKNTQEIQCFSFKQISHRYQIKQSSSKKVPSYLGQIFILFNSNVIIKELQIQLRKYYYLNEIYKICHKFIQKNPIGPIKIQEDVQSIPSIMRYLCSLTQLVSPCISQQKQPINLSAYVEFTQYLTNQTIKYKETALSSYQVNFKLRQLMKEISPNRQIILQEMVHYEIIQNKQDNYRDYYNTIINILSDCLESFTGDQSKSKIFQDSANQMKMKAYFYKTQQFISNQLHNLQSIVEAIKIYYLQLYDNRQGYKNKKVFDFENILLQVARLLRILNYQQYSLLIYKKQKRILELQQTLIQMGQSLPVEERCTQYQKYAEYFASQGQVSLANKYYQMVFEQSSIEKMRRNSKLKQLQLKDPSKVLALSQIQINQLNKLATQGQTISNYIHDKIQDQQKFTTFIKYLKPQNAKWLEKISYKYNLNKFA